MRRSVLGKASILSFEASQTRVISLLWSGKCSNSLAHCSACAGGPLERPLCHRRDRISSEEHSWSERERVAVATAPPRLVALLTPSKNT